MIELYNCIFVYETYYVTDVTEAYYSSPYIILYISIYADFEFLLEYEYIWTDTGLIVGLLMLAWISLKYLSILVHVYHFKNDMKVKGYHLCVHMPYTMFSFIHRVLD